MYANFNKSLEEIHIVIYILQNSLRILMNTTKMFHIFVDYIMYLGISN